MPRKLAKKGQTKGKKPKRESPFEGLFFQERIETFRDSWPFQRKLDTCNPHNLAICGFKNMSEGQGENRRLKANCVVCSISIEDLTAHSDPWMLHTAANKDCALVKLGRPQYPDSYKMRDILKLAAAKQTAEMKHRVELSNNQLVAKITDMSL